MRVLVCGGRNFDGRGYVFDILDSFDQNVARISVIVHGGADGADKLAKEWALARGRIEEEYPANWDDIEAEGAVVRTRRDGKKYNVLAGKWRNQLMLDVGRPQMVVAFGGGTGTEDMANRSRRAGIRVYEQTWVIPPGCKALGKK